MAINGKQIKNQLLGELLAWLWLGKVDMAVKILRNVKEDAIKNKKELENLINYFDRNRSCIPCYALRRNSVFACQAIMLRKQMMSWSLIDKSIMV